MGQLWSSEATKRESPVFVSLGMVVLDELHFPAQAVLYDVPGGSGLYATFGARAIHSGVGALILAGNDFPNSLMERIMQWKTRLLVKRLPNDPCTRGFVQYKDDDYCERTFRYVTPPLQPWPVDLKGSALLSSESFHLLANPETLQEMAVSLIALRNDIGQTKRPLIVWEPAPLFCNKNYLEQHLQACKAADVFSPNHVELAALMQDDEPDQPSLFSRKTVERHAKYFLDAGIGPENHGHVIIRCGEHGCLTLSHRTGADWLPSFYASPSPRIVDTTGAGNSFLGGFCVGLVQTGDVREAASLGSVAASFSIEQVGLPVFSPATLTAEETWNGARVSARLTEYRMKLSTD